jgi:CRP/FNR family transcriptional regulator
MPFSKREAPKCEWCPYRKNCLYDLLGNKKAKQTFRDMRIASPFRRGEVVFHEGTQPQGVYVVCKGAVKIYKSGRSGQQMIARIERGGDLLGHIALLSDEGPYTGTAEALDASVISMIDRKSFLDFLEKFPQASLALLRELSRDVRRSSNQARDIAFKPARGRLADALLRMMLPGRPFPHVLGLKRRDLADMSGLTIETSVRLLKDFELRGLIRRQGKDIAILQEAELRSLSGSAV